MAPMPRCSPLLALLWIGCGSSWKGADNDGDGVSAAEGDCWDAPEGPIAGTRGADLYPGAPDAWYDGLDANCAGDDDFDADGDGFVPSAHLGRSTFGVEGSGALPDGDCLDSPDAGFLDLIDAEDASATAFRALNGLAQPASSEVYPGAPDALYDDVDADCAGLDADEDGVNDDFDGDGDGHAAALPQRSGTVGGDCADGAPGEDPRVNLAGLALDAIFPDADELPYDGTDQDCSGVDVNADGLHDDCDQDLDGSPSDDAEDGEADGCFVEDCNDLDPRAVPDPSVAEVYYNGVDDNCLLRVDGEPDLDGDADGDGFWAADYPSRVPAPDATVGPLPDDYDDCWDDPTALPAGWAPAAPQAFDPTADWTAPGPAAYPAALTAAEAFPGALDRPYDGLDQDCRGQDTNGDGILDDFDWDGDGAASLYQAGPDGFGDDCLDCADACLEAEGALFELCAAVCDNDFSLERSEADNLTNRGGLDSSAVAPGAVEVWGDGTDGDCSRSSDYDEDADFYAADRYAGSPWAFEAERPFYYGDGDIVLDGGDCNDRFASIYPGATDLWYDGVDADCGGDDDYDADGDGHVRVVDAGAPTRAGPDAAAFGGALPADDCDDADPLIFGAGAEVWYDGVDGDCDGRDDYDQDGDGYADRTRAGDYGPTTYAPGTGVLPTTDCNDALATVRPGLAEAWYDGLDADCAGDDDHDADRDGYVPTSSAGLRTSQGTGTASFGGALPSGDCNDGLSAVRPGAADAWYDGVDSDCGGQDDYDRDADNTVQDVHLGLPTTQGAGTGAIGALRAGGDCNDGLAAVRPGATDAWYDGLDADCANNDDYDADADGYVRAADLGKRTGFGAGVATTFGGALPVDDCNDALATVRPGLSDAWYDGLDANCAGDDDYDADLDGYVQTVHVGLRTNRGPGTANIGSARPGGDCNDAAAAVRPGAVEVCDAVDNDCDALIDDADTGAGGVAYTVAHQWYADADRDGFGAAGAPTLRCSAPAGFIAAAGDCDDGSSLVNPSAVEVCDSGVDNNCSGGADDADPALDLSTRLRWYTDLDRDTFGAGSGLLACAAPTDGVLVPGDCDDTRADVNPDEAEVCNALRDDDCDGLRDEADPDLDPSSLIDWFIDGDGDGYGALGGAALAACAAPVGRVDDDSDCDDGAVAINPGADELCNDGEDNDCDGTLGTTAALGTCAYAPGTIASADQLFFTGTAGEDLGYALAFVPRAEAPGAHHLLVGAPFVDFGTGGGARDWGSAGVIAGQSSWGLSTNTTAAALSADRQTWRGEAKDDYFGMAVGAGDFDADGVVELFFGAPGWNNGGGGGNADYGKVYMLDLPSSGTIAVLDIGATAALSRGGGALNRFFGAALDVADADDDGDADLLVGGPECSAALAGDWGASPGTTGGAGRALFIAGGSGAGALTATHAARWLGSSVGWCAGGGVLWGDLDADGVMEAIIAEPYATGSGSAARAGRVYVDDLTATGDINLADLPYLWASEADSLLGRAMAVGDLDGDGVNELVLGEANDGSNSGAVYLIAGADLPTAGAALPEVIADTTLLGDAASRFLGASVAVPGDVDGAPDGLAELHVGASRANIAGGGTHNAEGGLYLFSGPLMVGGTVLVGPSTHTVLYADLANAWLGDRLIAGGDLNDDGLPDTVVAEAEGSASRGVHVLLGLGY